MINDVDIDDIVQIVASDEKLFRYIMKLVKNRLPRSMRKDKDWCTKVIDLSIQSALQEVRVIDIVKNMAEQQRLQQRYTDSDDDEILLPQISSDSEDDQVAIAPMGDDEGYYHNVSQRSQAFEDNENRQPESNNNDLSSRSNLNNSGMDNDDSDLRPQFSDNEPSTVSVNSPKRVLRNLNKYKNLPGNDDEDEPVMSLEIETSNLQGRNELEGNSGVIDTNESVESCAESEASTVQVTLQPNLSSSLQQDWEENDDVLASEEMKRSQAKFALGYDSQSDNFEHDGEGFAIPRGGMSQRYTNTDISVSNSNEQSLSPLPQDILHNKNDDDDDDDVLMGDSARQSQEQFSTRSEPDSHHSSSNSEKEPEANEENTYSHENDINDDLDAWERNVVDSIRKEREENMVNNDDQSHASSTNNAQEEENNEEIYVVHSSPMVSPSTKKSPSNDLPATLPSHLNEDGLPLHTHSISPAGSPYSTASPDRLKTRVPNRNILPHQTSPSHPGAFYPESNLNSAEKSSTHESPAAQKSSSSPLKSPNYHHDIDNEISEEEYSFTDYAADNSQLPQKDDLNNSTEKHYKDEDESVAEEDYEEDYEEEVEDYISQTKETQNDESYERSPLGSINATKASSPVMTPTAMKTPGSSKGSKKKVFFSDNVVSNIYYRDRVDPSEKKLLFYAHEDEWRFGEDQSREMAEADKMGLTWAEWVEKYHHDHDDGLGNYGKRTVVSNGKGSATMPTNLNTNDNRKMDFYTSGDDEFEMAEEDSDGLYDFEYDEDF